MRAGKVAWHLGLLLGFGATRIAAQAPVQDPGGHDHMMMGDQGDEMMMGDSMDMGRHLRLTPHWPERPGDRERADSVSEVARQALARYEDVRVAEADGYHMFAARIKKQGVYHYSNRSNAVRARREFDVTRPSALLYQPQRDGSLRLIGAMYTAPPDLSLDQLDERLPLSIAQWHQHTSICLPPGSSVERCRRRDGFCPDGLSLRPPWEHQHEGGMRCRRRRVPAPHVRMDGACEHVFGRRRRCGCISTDLTPCPPLPVIGEADVTLVAHPALRRRLSPAPTTSPSPYLTRS